MEDTDWRPTRRIETNPPKPFPRPEDLEKERNLAIEKFIQSMGPKIREANTKMQRQTSIYGELLSSAEIAGVIATRLECMGYKVEYHPAKAQRDSSYLEVEW